MLLSTESALSRGCHLCWPLEIVKMTLVFPKQGGEFICSSVLSPDLWQSAAFSVVDTAIQMSFNSVQLHKHMHVFLQ